jgi:hypothetical protein
MKTSEKIIFPLIFLLVLIGVGLSHYRLEWYEGIYVREDGPIEWLTFLPLVMGFFLCWYRASILKPFRSKTFYCSLLFLGLVFLFGAGEEISWGQRIFDWKSSQFFMQNNTQMETNLHNLFIGSFKFNRVIFGTTLGILIGFYFIILPLLYRKFEKIKLMVDSFALPLPKVFHIIFYIVLVSFVAFTKSEKKGELLEFGGCWIFLMMTFRPYNRQIFSRVSFQR